MKHVSIALGFLMVVVASQTSFLPCVAAAAPAKKLSVSPDRRHLLKDGQPFFWLGDTAWFIMRLSDDEIREYLSNRAHKGFTGIQVDLNAYAWTNLVPAGQMDNPFFDDDPERPNESYWRRVDRMVDEAARQGLCVLLTPMWGKHFPRYVDGDTAKASRLGKWLGSRYGDRAHVMWFVAGEYDSINGYRPISSAQKTLLNSVAQGLEDGHGGRQLMTIHPGGRRDSAVDFHDQAWLDFNMLQSGHFDDATKWSTPENHTLIALDYERRPTKPVFDGEPAYEDMIDGYFKGPKDGTGSRMGSDVMRRKAYWAVFAGAFGHTYGHNDVQIFWSPGKPREAANRNHWRDALEAPGAGQMRYLRLLIESRPWHTMEPDQNIVVAGQGAGKNHLQAARAADGKFLFVYLPRGNKLTVDMAKIHGSRATSYWFNPRNGESTPIGEYSCSGTRQFSPPSQAADNDWVLVLDDVRCKFPIPGNVEGEMAGRENESTQ
jgi:hypothetical protein